MTVPTRITSKPNILTQARPQRVNIPAQQRAQQLREIRRTQEERNIQLEQAEAAETEQAQTRTYEEVKSETEKYNRLQTELASTGTQYNKLIEKYNTSTNPAERAELENQIKKTVKKYNDLSGSLSAQASRQSATVQTAKISGVISEDTPGASYTPTKIADPFAYRQTREYRDLEKSSVNVEATKNLLTYIGSKYNILISQYNEAAPEKQTSIESQIMETAGEYNRISGALSQQVSQYNAALRSAQTSGAISQDAKPISYTDSQIIPKFTQTEDQISQEIVPLSTQIDYRQKSNNNFNIGKTVLTGFAGLMSAAKTATTALPGFIIDIQKQEPEKNQKLESLSSIPMINVSKTFGSTSEIVRTIQKSPEDAAKQLDTSLLERNVGLIDFGNAIKNIGIAGSTYAQRSIDKTPSVSITTATSPIMKNIGSGISAIGEDLEKSRTYFAEGMFSINEGQLQYNEPGVLTSISFGLATAGISGAVLKTAQATGGFALPRIINIGEKGAETFVSTGGRTLSSGGGNVVSLSAEQAAVVASKLAAGGAAVGSTVKTPTKMSTVQDPRLVSTSDINVPIDDYAELYRTWREDKQKKKIVEQPKEGFRLEQPRETVSKQTLERIITTETPSSIKISRAEAYESVNAPEIIIRKDFERSFPEINIFETPDRIQTRKREEEIDKTEEVYRDANSLRLDYPYIYEYAEINDISIRPRKFKDFSLDEKTPKKSKKRKTKTSAKYRLVSSYVPSAKDLFPSITRTKPKSKSTDLLRMGKRK